MVDPNDDVPLHGFSIATLMLLTVVVAIGAAAARTLVIASNVTAEGVSDSLKRAVQLVAAPTSEVVLRGIVGGTIGLLVGIYLGLTRKRPVLGVPLAAVVGVCVGAFAGVVFMEPRNLLVAAIGAALLILLGVVVRGLSRRPHEP
jgi:hypothetical protein